MYTYYILLLQCDNLKGLVAKLREVLVKKDEVDPEEMKKQTNELQQASLKLFEMAYKKVIMKINLRCYTAMYAAQGPHYLNALILQMAAERESQNQSQQESEGEKKEEKN